MPAKEATVVSCALGGLSMRGQQSRGTLERVRLTARKDAPHAPRQREGGSAVAGSPPMVHGSSLPREDCPMRAKEPSPVISAAFPVRLRLPQAAEYLAVSPRSLSDRGWRLKHGIPCFKLGKAVIFDRAALDRWLAKHQERRMRDFACAAQLDSTPEGGAA